MTQSSGSANVQGLTATQREQLAAIIFHRSFGRGQIVLASGRTSDFYFDMKPTMLDPQGASLIARGLLAEIVKSGATFAGGLEMGAVPITGALCQLSFDLGAPVRGFFVRKQPKGHGAKKLVEGLMPTESLAGERVVVVEDVTTTGESAFKAVEALKASGADIVLVISIVDRLEGAAAMFAERGLNFRSLFSATDFLSRS